MREIRVFVVEEDKTIREGMGAIVRLLPDLAFVGQAGNIKEALEKLPTARPQLIVLDHDDGGAMDDNTLITRLLQAQPQVNIICTSRRWDATASRLALEAGAKGYLAKPFTGEELLTAIRSIDDPPLLPLSEVITLFSPKGGCGKTTLAANLALGLAEQTGQKVGLVDANLQFGDLAVFFNITPVGTILEAARDIAYLSPATLSAYLTAYNRTISVLAAPYKAENAELIQASDITGILKLMRNLFRYVVVDTAPGFHDISLAAIEAADIVYVLAALNSGRELDHVGRSLEMFRTLGYNRDKVRVVLTRVKSREEAKVRHFEDQWGYPVSALLPNDFRLATTAANSGVPLFDKKSDSPLVKGIVELISDIAAGESGKQVSANSGNKPSLFTRLFGG